MGSVDAILKPMDAFTSGDQQAVVLCTVAAVIAVALLAWWTRYTAKYSYYSAPSPRIRAPWWLLGHVEVVERVIDRHQLYREWHEQLGPFVRIRIAHRSMLMVADPAAASSILVKGPGYVAKKPPEYTAFDVAHGLHGYNGMLTHQDEGTWRAARKAITPAFALNEVKRRYPVILSCLCDTVTALDRTLLKGFVSHNNTAGTLEAPQNRSAPLSSNGGNTGTSSQPSPLDAIRGCSADFDVEHHMLVAANQMMARGFLQLPEGFFNTEQLACDVGFLMETASRFICEPWRWFAHLYLPFITQEGRRMWSARRRLAATAERIYDLLQDRYGKQPPPETDNSLAACLMRVTDKEGRKPKRGALVAEICDALTASETVPSTVMWTLYCIATRPQLQQQLQEELLQAGIAANTTSAVGISGAHDTAAKESSSGVNSSNQLDRCHKVEINGNSTTLTAADDAGKVCDQAVHTCSSDATDKQPPPAVASSAPAAAAAAASTESAQRQDGPESIQQGANELANLLQQRQQRLLEQFSSSGPDLFKHLPLLQACLYETMRLFPAGAPGAPRLTEVPIQVGPYLVPPGVLVFPNIFTIMNYSRNWQQPEKFDPERWSEPHPDKDSSGATRWVPFSLGPKACAGQNLALLQCKAALAMLLAGYEWKLAPSMGGEEGVAARTYLGVTIKVRDGLWFTATPRA